MHFFDDNWYNGDTCTEKVLGSETECVRSDQQPNRKIDKVVLLSYHVLVMILLTFGRTEIWYAACCLGYCGIQM